MKHTVHEFKLAGGAKGLVIDVPGSRVVNVAVRFNSGYQFAPRTVYEVPHVMEHLVGNVTKRHPGPNEFHIEATKNGAYVNAYTSPVMNGYVYECAAFELGRILDLLEEQLTEPLIEAKELAVEIKNVREELSRNTTQHGSVCAVQLGEATFPKLVMGYDERIAQLPNITSALARDHFERTHTAANARFYVAGSFDDEGAAIAARLDAMFTKMVAGERLVPNAAMGLGLARPVVARREIAQIYYRAEVYFGELDEAERRALVLWRTLLTGGFGSRILGEARRRGLAYHVSGMAQAEPGRSMVGMAGYVTPEHVRPLFELMAREVAAMRRTAVAEAELTAAKDLVIGTIERSMQTPSDLLSWYVDRYDDSGEILDYDRVLGELRAVTAAQVQAVGAKAATAGRFGLSLVGPVSEKEANEFAKLLGPLFEK